MPVKIFLAPIDMRGRGIMLDNTNPKVQGEFTKVALTDSLEESDYIALPKSINKVRDAQDAISKGKAFAKAHNKPLIIFYYGDHSYKEHVSDAISFKWSAHRQDKLPVEVIIPVFISDLAKEREIVWRHKSAKPSIGFCGFASFPSLKTAFRYHVENLRLNVWSVITLNPEIRARKRGLYFRRKGMRLLKKDALLETHFIVRSAFFNQVQAPPQDLRNEYLDNLQNCDFVLAPRGDANISTRFFEALSLGRIPVLIDTDCVLPLEKHIDYSKFIVRIPHIEMHTMSKKLLELYDSISDEEFIEMQKRAREAYIRYLEVGPFCDFVFPILKNEGPEML